MLTRVEEPGGKIVNIAYGPYGDVVSVTDDQGIGHFFEFDYDKGTREYYAYTRFTSGKVKEVWYDYDSDTKRVDINGTTVQSIKSDGRTQWVTDARGFITRQELDEWDNIVRTVYPDESWIETTYQQPGNFLVQVNRMGIKTTYEYNEFGYRIAENKAVGTNVERRTEFTFNSDGRATTRTIKGESLAQDSTTVYDYDLSGHLISVTDPEGRTTRLLDYDTAGNPKTIEDGLVHQKHFEYDAGGNVRFIRDHSNKLIAEYRYDEGDNRSSIVNGYLKEYQFVYDSRKNLISVIDPLGSSSTYDYNVADKPVKTTDQEGHLVYYEYDLFERLLKTIDGEGNEISYEYTAADGCSSCSGGSDLVSKIIYPTFSREFSYDKRGRVVVQKDVFDDKEMISSYSYDEFGNRKTITDSENNVTSYDYDALGRLIVEHDARGDLTEYIYDKRGNLLQLTDANKGITLFTYDLSDKLLSEIRPMLQSISYSYDAAGNLKEQTDSNGRKTVYTNDENNRLVKSEIFAASTDAAPTKTVSYSYNDVGSLTGYDDVTTSAVYTYDDLQRRTNESVDYGSFSLVHSYGYYKNSQKKNYTDPAGRIRTWNYDKANRPLGLDPGNGAEISIGSYVWSRPCTITLPGGATLNYSYNGLQQVVSITPRDPGSNPVLDYGYSYKFAGNVASKSTEHGDYVYDYDQLYRLTSAQKPDANESYGYDGLGNRTSSDKATPWVYNDNNQLHSYATTNFAYDNQGNMTGRTVNGTTTTFSYSVDNRLEKVEDQSGTEIASYYYDPYGRRLWKDVAGVRTNFHYNDDGLVGEYNGTGSELKTYGYQPGSPWSTNPLFVQVGGEYYWYQNDHLGTPQKIISGNGTVVWSARYDSFGQAVVGTETVKNNLRFPGQYFDSETDLHYNWHRFYDPETGRYISADPIGLGGGMNLYSYVGGDPVNAADPWGLRSFGSKIPRNIYNTPRKPPKKDPNSRTPPGTDLDYPYAPNSENGMCEPCTPSFHPSEYWSCVYDEVSSHLPEYGLAFAGMATPTGWTQVSGAVISVSMSWYIGAFCHEKAMYCDKY